MAIYTELFAEYIENGGEIPAIFNDIIIGESTLTDIFTAYYADREIGFETPSLFALKLNAYAAIHIPELKAGLEAFSGALKAMNAPTRTHIKNGAIQREYSQRKRNVWENPAANNEDDIELNDVGSQNITIDAPTDEKEVYKAVTDIDEGKSVGDGIAVYEALSKPAQTFLAVWLKKFEPLFMQIF